MLLWMCFQMKSVTIKNHTYYILKRQTIKGKDSWITICMHSHTLYLIKRKKEMSFSAAFNRSTYTCSLAWIRIWFEAYLTHKRCRQEKWTKFSAEIDEKIEKGRKKTNSKIHRKMHQSSICVFGQSTKSKSDIIICW